jgi:hypothetical protein
MPNWWLFSINNNVFISEAKSSLEELFVLCLFINIDLIYYVQTSRLIFKNFTKDVH